MPIFKSGAAQAANPLNLSFVERLRTGRVVPVVSERAIGDVVLRGWEGLVQGYARLVDYPLPDSDNLARVAKYRQLYGADAQGGRGMKDQELKADYLNWVKNHIYHGAEAAGADPELLREAEAQVDPKSVSAFAQLFGLPDFEDSPAAAMLVWAHLPVSLVLTTSPHTFIEDAFRRVGKAPRTELCRWHRELDGIPPAIDAGYRPSAQEPLVYHLHGLDTYSESLVLTEDDYLEFLVNICQGQGNNAADRVPALVRQALFNDLILIGFQLASWSFRTLYSGLIKPNAKQEDRGEIVLQVTPSDAERRFVDDYMRREARFEVAWGTIGEYTELLREKMAGR